MFIKIFGIAATLFAALLINSFYFGYTLHLSIDSDKYQVRGIDVSHHQGEIDWSMVSNDNVSFAYIKATEADDFIDNQFAKNLANAQSAGLKVGAYHFYSLGYPGEIQAQNFISQVPTSTINLPPVIDLEYVGNSKIRPTKEQFQKELKIFIKLTEDYFMQEPVLYTTYEFSEDYLVPEFSNYKIWIRDIFGKPNESKIKNIVFWQYHSRGRVKGIDGPVDLNFYKENSMLEF